MNPTNIENQSDIDFEDQKLRSINDMNSFPREGANEEKAAKTKKK
jgi:hypothetical protein